MHERSQRKPPEEPSTQPPDAPTAELRRILVAALEHVLPKPSDGPDEHPAVLAEHHLSTVDCLKGLEGALPALRNMQKKTLQKRQAPSEDVLRATSRKVCDTLVPLQMLAQHLEFFKWCISVYLVPKHLSAGASESAIEVTEDEDDNFGVPEELYGRK